MIDSLLALDPATTHETVTYLAQGGGWGNSGVSTVDNLVVTVIQIIGAIIGIGFFIQAGKAGFGPGDQNKKGREALMNILWGIGLAAVFLFVPALLGEAKGLLGDVL